MISWIMDCMKTGLNDVSKDNRDKILLMYIVVPSFLIEAIRVIFLSYYKTIGIKIDVLIKGKWMPQNINIKKTLVQSLFVTQGISLGDHEHDYYDAINFFTSEKKPIHRNKVAHGVGEILDSVNSITMHDLIKKIAFIFHLLVYFENIIWGHGMEEKV